MGDRRNVVVEFDNETSVALYTHWSGSELPQTLASALLRGQDRWTDPTYLTRIIFSEMIRDSVMDTTGYGIEPIPYGSIHYCEASPGYDITVDIANQSVTLGGKVYSFAVFTNEFLPKA